MLHRILKNYIAAWAPSNSMNHRSLSRKSNCTPSNQKEDLRQFFESIFGPMLNTGPSVQAPVCPATNGFWNIGQHSAKDLRYPDALEYGMGWCTSYNLDMYALGKETKNTGVDISNGSVCTTATASFPRAIRNNTQYAIDELPKRQR